MFRLSVRPGHKIGSQAGTRQTGCWVKRVDRKGWQTMWYTSWEHLRALLQRWLHNIQWKRFLRSQPEVNGVVRKTYWMRPNKLRQIRNHLLLNKFHSKWFCLLRKEKLSKGQIISIVVQSKFSIVDGFWSHLIQRNYDFRFQRAVFVKGINNLHMQCHWNAYPFGECVSNCKKFRAHDLANSLLNFFCLKSICVKVFSSSSGRLELWIIIS